MRGQAGFFDVDERLKELSTVSAVRGLTAHVGLVKLNDLVLAPKRAGRGVGGHALADAVGHEPSGLVGHAQHAVKLMRRHALFGRGDQVRGKQPLVQRDMAALHHRSGSRLRQASATLPCERWRGPHCGRSDQRCWRPWR